MNSSKDVLKITGPTLSRIDLGAGKNNKLNFLWPKMARLGPLFWAQNPPEKVYHLNLWITYIEKFFWEY